MKKHTGIYEIKKPLLHEIWKYRLLMIMLMPAFLYFIIFRYGPMFGLLIAFQDYAPKIGQNFFMAIVKGRWIGLKHFSFFFSNTNALRALRNTIIISLYKLFIGFPVPIILALLLNELKNIHFKKMVQTISYLPHFMSWVILAGIMRVLFSPDYGVIIPLFNILNIGHINLLGDSRYFRGMLVLSEIWQNAGWDSVIYLAALSSLDVMLYEAARIDGANRFQQFWSITLPGITSTIIIMFILRIGLIMNAGFDQVFNLVNVAVDDVGDIIDTFVYRAGLQNAQFSYSAAIGFFKSLVGFTLVLITNKIIKILGYESIL
jgi:putative aldouronate transport system permease protein